MWCGLIPSFGTENWIRCDGFTLALYKGEEHLFFRAGGAFADVSGEHLNLGIKSSFEN